MSDVARLLISCPDRPGIVAAVSQFLFEHGANIIHSDQHSSDQGQGTSSCASSSPSLLVLRDVRAEFAALLGRFGMQWRLSYVARPHRLAIFVSRQDHALVELLWQRAAGDLQAEIALVISNHTNNERLVAEAAFRFSTSRCRRRLKPAGRSARARHYFRVSDVDTVVLARYMQVLSSEFLARYPAAIINIHHSFLPAFVGANPYEAAYDRGVKLIGATAHYVTEELDAGPIIEQDVQRVDHRHGPADLRRMGRYIERVVLARAVTWHVEDRVLLHGNKTVVFS